MRKPTHAEGTLVIGAAAAILLWLLGDTTTVIVILLVEAVVWVAIRAFEPFKKE